MGSLQTLFHVTALTLAALLPIINPPGAAPIFLSLTAGSTVTERTALARSVALNCAMLLLGSMLIGSYVLNFFGLSLSVIKMAGGLLVISTGWKLIGGTAAETSTAVDTTPRADAQMVGTSFYPLAFPLTIGPGSISVAITLGAGARLRNTSQILPFLGTAAGMLIAVVLIYFCYRFAARVVRALGESGTVVLLRLSAFILLAIGLQILCDGIVDRFDIL